MYVAYTKKRYKDKVYTQVLLRESYRENGEVKSRTIANITNMPKEKVEALALVLKSKDGSSVVDTQMQSQGKTVGFSLVIIYILKLLGVFKAFATTFEAKVALMLIVARVVSQGSRLQALKWAKDEDKVLELLDFKESEIEALDNKSIYVGLDYMEENQEKIENKLFKHRYKDNPPKRLFYDVTSSYVEGDYEESELVRYGYNRDGKKGKKQIVIGLLTDEDGRAISIHTYSGNTNDVKTFKDQLDKLKNRFNLESITIVGDGGMIKSDDIEEIKKLGYDYITSIGKSSIRALLKDQDSKIELSLFDNKLSEVIDEEKGVRYILRQNPKRRDEIRRDRDKRVESLKKYIESKSRYYNTHYRAKKETLEKNIAKKIEELKLKALVSCSIEYEEKEISVDKKTKSKLIATVSTDIDAITKAEIEKLDGCYVITTSLLDVDKNTKDEIHKAYKTLIKVECAFRVLKTDYLEIRPLYLKSDKRIKGHVALSMIAYNAIFELKAYIKKAKLDFISTIRKLEKVQTVVNTINKTISYETIPKVSQELDSLFKIIGAKIPSKL